MKAVRRWSHYLYGKCFDPVTDQRALSFMLDKTSKRKVKNRKIQLWRAELGCFDYRIQHRPGKLNVVPDSLSRIQVALVPTLAISQTFTRSWDILESLG